MRELKFVDVGEGITEGNVAKWLVKDGDTVKEDQPILQVETDKAVVNIPAPVGGKVRIEKKENTVVKVGETLAYIDDGNGAAAPKADTAAAPASAAPTTEVARHAEIMATPSVRKLAHDLGADITKVVGTGPNGRILENDVRAYKSTGAAAATSLKPKFSEVLEEAHSQNIERQPMSQTRKTIAKNMELSWTIPRAVHMELIDADNLVAVVSKEKERVKKEFGVKLTFLPFIIKAVERALHEYPKFNSSYDHETQEIILKDYFNIGLAAEGPDGLKVVVIKDSDRRSIVELANEIQELHEKVAGQTIAIEEMRDSTFTITNIGSLGGGFLSVPMINYPEVAILGVQMIREMAVVKEGKVVAGKVLPVSLSFDHRVVDGAEAVKFVNAIKAYLEDIEFLEIT
jgi:pyruvate dehydrogenase E2 component (dihydrolipoamide acetyltransferase)